MYANVCKCLEVKQATRQACFPESGSEVDAPGPMLLMQSAKLNIKQNIYSY